MRGTKKEAEARLAQMLHEVNTGAFVEPAKMSVAEYLKRWLSEYAAHNVAPKDL